MASVFSIIMPVYNVEKYLEEAISSVLAQSFKDFELIIVNDGSTDGSVIIAERFATLDKRIQILHKQNGGLSSARNEGLKYAKGTYLYFLDSDDFINADTLECIHDIFLKYSVEIVAFTADSFFHPEYFEKKPLILEQSMKHYSREFLKEGVYSGVEYYENSSLHNNFVVSACMHVVKKSLVDNLRLNFYEGIIHEDALYTRQLFLSSDKVFFLKNKFYNRRIRNNSISTSIISIQKVYSYLIVAEELDKLNTRLKNDLLNEDVFHFYNEAINFLKSFKKRSKDYDKVVDRLFHSNLNKRYKSDLNTVLQLKFKKLGALRNLFARLRFKIGLRTRLKFFFNLSKK